MNTTHQRRWGLSLAEVLAEESMRPFHLVPGIIDAHATMLAGKSEGGKSTLLSDLAAAALSGGDFLGREFTTEVRRVVVIAADLGGAGEYARRLHDRGVDPDATPDSRCLLVPFRHPQPHEWNELVGEVRPRIGDLVIVDPVSFLIPEGGPSINTDEGVRAIWGPLGRWSELGAAVVAVHHLSNKHQFGESSAMGSSLFTGAARINLQLRRRGKAGPIELSTSPNSGPPELMTLEYHPDGLRLVGTEDGLARARTRAAERSGLWQAIAERVVKEHPMATNADVGRYIASWHPELTKATDKGRELSKRLTQGRDFGGYLSRNENGQWQLVEPGGAR